MSISYSMGTMNHGNAVEEGLQVVQGTIELPGYVTRLYRMSCMPILLSIVCSVVSLVKA